MSESIRREMSLDDKLDRMAGWGPGKETWEEYCERWEKENAHRITWVEVSEDDRKR